MKIVIAPQTFKGSISALDVARAIQAGILFEMPDAQCEIVPVADGGDGTLETLVEISGGEIKTSEVTGPLGDRFIANWGGMGDRRTAVIEMARISGLALVPIEPIDQRNPLKATTFGLGEAFVTALNSGYRRFIIGIGGSATNDAGAGMAQALGAKLVGNDGNELTLGGGALADLAYIDLSSMDSRVADCEILVACDVTNPLTGPEGASTVFGPQKGASADMIVQLDEALGNFAKIVKRDVGIDIDNMIGSGAAGGLGGGMVAFLGADLAPGVDIVLDTIGFDKHLAGADLVITGEGALDSSTIYNKAPIGVARRAEKLGIPVVAIGGTLGDGHQLVYDHGISAVCGIINAPMALSDASDNAASLITDATRQMMRMLILGSKVFQ